MFVVCGRCVVLRAKYHPLFNEAFNTERMVEKRANKNQSKEEDEYITEINNIDTITTSCFIQTRTKK